MPASANATPHAPATQVRAAHSVSEPPHCATRLHCTHAPVPSHTTPPPCEHAVSAAFGVNVGTPAEHDSVVHCWPSSAGTSLLNGALTVPPAPVHSRRRQS